MAMAREDAASDGALTEEERENVGGMPIEDADGEDTDEDEGS
ncbi:hypothetical protein SMD44_p10086 (plasmid) [Streptomyces alboflavus]|uniref:Uncharacterized protein n=1 Tax=Streptomyces alboflavus TaxID=67267 RepID=A0A291W382_9ACTN|nr:hypothetical protein SMD44_p10086 [Streptomyces alboflavus]